MAGTAQKVGSVVLNEGAAQRSMVNQITVTFNGAAILDPGAIELRGQDASLVNFHLAVSVVGGQTVAVLTFTGTEFIRGSLPARSYTLPLPPALPPPPPGPH